MTRLINNMLVLCLLFVGFQTVSAQVDDLSSVEIIGAQGVYESAFMIRPEGRYRKIKGSPYLNPEWEAGKVWLEGDTVSAGFPMRYNVYGNEMQFIYNRDTFAIANPLSISKIALSGKIFEYLAFTHNDNPNMAYFEVLTSGVYRLLVRHEVRLQAGREPLTPYHPQNEYDRFVKITNYYLQGPDQPDPVAIPGSKKEWYAYAGDHKDQLKAMFSKKKIHLNKREDLIKVVEFLNEINE